MELIGNSNDRQIYYTNIWINIDWLENLPTENWIVFPIGENMDNETYRKLPANVLRTKYYGYVQPDKIVNSFMIFFDEMVTAMKVEKDESIENPDDFENSPLTTWSK